jgi:hypothetical protein
MYTPFNGPPITPQDVDAWLLAAAERRAALHRKAASPVAESLSPGRLDGDVRSAAGSV